MPWIYLICPPEREVRFGVLVALFGWGFLMLPAPNLLTTSFEVSQSLDLSVLPAQRELRFSVDRFIVGYVV